MALGELNESSFRIHDELPPRRACCCCCGGKKDHRSPRELGRFVRLGAAYSVLTLLLALFVRMCRVNIPFNDDFG